jgi:hypothetical protein
MFVDAGCGAVMGFIVPVDVSAVSDCSIFSDAG